MMPFVPLHHSALERSQHLIPWLHSWVPATSLIILMPEEWFVRGHGLSGGAINWDNIWIPHKLQEVWFLWSPPPAAAATVLHELSISRHK